LFAVGRSVAADRAPRRRRLAGLFVARGGGGRQAVAGARTRMGGTVHTDPQCRGEGPVGPDLKVREVAQRLDRSEAQVRAVFGTDDVVSPEWALPDE
jgi:hypothetical protein